LTAAAVDVTIFVVTLSICGFRDRDSARIATTSKGAHDNLTIVCDLLTINESKIIGDSNEVANESRFRRGFLDRGLGVHLCLLAANGGSRCSR
jgi:hypothetical protein